MRRSLRLSLPLTASVWEYVPLLVVVLGFGLVGSGRDALAAERIYVSAEDAGEIAVIDPDIGGAGSVVGRIPVGKRPRGVRLSPDGKLLYVALSGTPKNPPGHDEAKAKLPPADRTADGIGVVDRISGKLLRVLASGQDPESMDVSPDGRLLFVSNEETAEMTVLDLGSGKVVTRVPVGREPEGVTTHPGGKSVFVTSEEDGAVVGIDTHTFKEIARIPTGARPRSITFTRDGKLGFVSSEFGAEVSVFDVARKKPLNAIKIVPVAKTPLGPRPMGTVLSPDGKSLYVSNGRGESVAVIDVARRKLTRVIDGVGARPWGIGVSTDGKRIYTANGPSNDVSIIDVKTGKVERRIAVPGLPWGLVVAPAP